MSRLAILDPRFRPQPITTLEVERSAQVTNQLLETPTDWLRRMHCARLDVSLEPASKTHLNDSQRAAIEDAGFRTLCTAWVQHPGPTGRIERRVDVWLDPTATIRAEIVGEPNVHVYFGMTFDDGSSLVLLPDPVVADWVSSPTCEALTGSGDVRADLALFNARAAELARTRTPLLCANGDAYRMHLRLAALRAKRPRTMVRCGDIGFMYPMTVLLAAEMVARREDFSEFLGLPA